ncbi:MAG: TetR/AcrR family transcriptional regulator [Lachnospiraceae bacterium]|nr:TetR/AcrR family transcriptional regulator [Lachnospiraceae bacterium]
MSQFTKKAIIDSFIELSQTVPIEKISVTMISKHCGINRNTFYYYFQDVYSLMEELIYSKSEKLFPDSMFLEENGWISSLRFMGQYAKKNEVFIKNLYQSMGRDAFGDYMSDLAYQPARRQIDRYVDNMYREEGLTLTREQRDVAAYLFAKMFSETTVDWIRGKRGDDPAKTMEQAIVMMDGIAEHILHNMAKESGKKKN